MSTMFLIPSKFLIPLFLLPLFFAHAQECSTCGCYHHSEAEAHAISVVVASVTGCQCAEIPNSSALETTFTLQIEAVEKGVTTGHACTPGGILGNVGQQDSRSIFLKPGTRYRLFLDEKNILVAAEPLDDPDEAESGGVGSTTPSGFLEGNTGIPGRFTIPDQGRPLHYLVDADHLPKGITQTQALQAVADALAAWEDDSGLTFKFDGISSFGVSAREVPHNRDQRLYIQLHDFYNAIEASTTLGIGGRGITIPGYASDGGGGGTLDDLAFHQTSYGYVVIHHTAPSNETLINFTENLTHEIGHALGLAHSSENPNETDSEKKNAIMYYRSQGNGRGATLGEYDEECIEVGYPDSDFVPFSVNRTFYSADTTVTPGLNQFSLLPRDLGDSDSNLELKIISSSSSSGTYSFSGDTMTFSLRGNFQTQTLDYDQILGGSFFDQVIFRVSNGTNISPYYTVRRIGNVSPQAPAPTLVSPTLVSDGDFNLSWDTEPYKTYEVQTSEDGTDWTTNELLWATSTSASSSSYLLPLVHDSRLVRVLAWP